MDKSLDELCATLSEIASRAPTGEMSEIVDLTEVVLTTTFRVITNVAFAFDMPREDRLAFADSMNIIIEEMMKDAVQYPFRQLLTPFGVRNRMLRTKKELHEMCQRFLTKRLQESNVEKAARRPDILDIMLEQDDIKNLEVISLIIEFGLAGSHTTNQMVMWAVYESCCNKRVQKEIEKELSERFASKPANERLTLNEVQNLPYMTKVWKETCRLHPIGSGLLRVATKDTKLAGSGVRIAKGTNILLLNSITQKDPALWESPEECKPERWGFGKEHGDGDLVPAGAYLPFGKGSLSCAGTFLANYEGVLILAELYRKFKIELACDAEDVVTCTLFVDVAKSASVKGGKLDRGMPVRIALREQT